MQSMRSVSEDAELSPPVVDTLEWSCWATGQPPCGLRVGRAAASLAPQPYGSSCPVLPALGTAAELVFAILETRVASAVVSGCLVPRTKEGSPHSFNLPVTGLLSRGSEHPRFPAVWSSGSPVVVTLAWGPNLSFSGAEEIERLLPAD